MIWSLETWCTQKREVSINESLRILLKTYLIVENAGTFEVSLGGPSVEQQVWSNSTQQATSNERRHVTLNVEQDDTPSG